MKRILLLDTSFSAKPIYDYLKSTGAEVFVVGGKSQDSLAKSVNNYINCDYSKIDELSNIIKEYKFDYLVPGGNDFSYKVCSEVNEAFNFYNICSVKTNEIINDKALFRKFAEENELHVPKRINPEDIKNKIPVIIKPVDAYSGHGITIVKEYSESVINESILKAKKYSKNNSVIIEEFVTGQLYSHSAFIHNKKILKDFIVEEHCIVSPFAVDTSFVDFSFDKNILGEIRKDINKLVEELDLCDGLVHTQFILNNSDFWLIEITRRCPGDLYSRLIEFSTGFPYAEFYARPFLNKPYDLTHIREKKEKVIRHTITVPEPITYNMIHYNNKSENICFVPLSATGDLIQESPFSRIGIIFINAKDDNIFNSVLTSTLQRNLYTLE